MPALQPLAYLSVPIVLFDPPTLKAMDSISEFKKHPGQTALMLFISLFLLLFLVIPVILVIFTAFRDTTTGGFTLLNFKDFFSTSLFRESFWKSSYVGLMSVLVPSAFSLPLSYFTS